MCFWVRDLLHFDRAWAWGSEGLGRGHQACERLRLCQGGKGQLPPLNWKARIRRKRLSVMIPLTPLKACIHTLEPPAQSADIVLSLFSFFLSPLSPWCVLSSSLPPSAPYPPHPPKPFSPQSPSLVCMYVCMYVCM